MVRTRGEPNLLLDCRRADHATRWRRRDGDLGRRLALADLTGSAQLPSEEYGLTRLAPLRHKHLQNTSLTHSRVFGTYRNTRVRPVAPSTRTASCVPSRPRT